MINHLQKYLFLYLLAVAALNITALGVLHNPAIWSGGSLGSDALGYYQYAHNIAAGNGYNTNGVGFNAVREPGYPAFLALIYFFVGVDNMRAVVIIQAVILALTGYLAYLISKRSVGLYAALTAAFAVILTPYYGYYGGEYMTELPFAFALFCCAYITIRHFEHTSDMRLQILCGLAFAAATLIRVQMLLFPMLYVLVVLAIKRDQLKKASQSVAVVLFVYLVPILMWSSVVYTHTGNFMITEGRQEMLFHVRAVRSTLSYSQLTSYAKEWIVRSVSGGETDLPFLLAYDLKGIKNEYKKIAISPERIQEIKQEDIQTIQNNIGPYLFGNMIELMKLLYIEHDYSDYMSKYFRLATYVSMYSVFILGLTALLRARRSVSKELQMSIGFVLLIIIYHLGLLTFLETVPRFNTPLHGLYVLVGVMGIGHWLASRMQKNNITNIE